MMTRTKVLRAAAACTAFSVLSPAFAVRDLSFDYTSFETTFGQSQFNVLNYPSINGNYMMTSSDNHRPEMVANNNELTQYYDTLTDTYVNQTVKDGAAAADIINTYAVNRSTSNGPKPTWYVLNEISPSLWSADPGDPSISTYRTWLINCLTRLTSVHGYKVITLAPFQNPTQNNASWQAVSAIPNSYIGIECYLSGPEVMAGGADWDSRREWAEDQYRTSKNSYLARGVPANRLFVIEHVANTALTTDNGTTVRWGRNNLASASDWDQVLMLRQDAIYNVGFDGFLTYAWGGNGMNVTTAEQIQHEYYYRSRLVLHSQQPQWLSDAAPNVNGTVIPQSWNHFLNWKGGVPNAPGAVANFYRTNTAARTITLDAAQTVGTLSFNSPNSYTITAGTGGSLTFNNNGAGASIAVPQGTHVINAPLTAADNLTVNVTSNLSFSGAVTINAAKTLTKSGAGTLTITGTQSHAANSAINATAGALNLNTDAGSPTSRVVSITASATVNMNATQHLASLTVNPNGTATLQPGGGRLLVTNNFIAGGGRVDIGDNRMIVDYSTFTPLLSIRSALLSGRGGTGFANATWNGSGIKSSAAQLADKVSFALGYVDNSFLPQLGLPSYTSFGGQSVDSNSILIRYTLGADANLDGRVNTDDVTILGATYNTPGTGHWFLGDFDYDGIVDTDDITVLGALYDPTDPPFSAAQLTAQYGFDFAAAFERGRSLGSNVPEPAGAIVVLVPGITALCMRRRRPDSMRQS